MSIKQSVWKVGEDPQALIPSKLKDEKLLEDMIERDPTILDDEWLIIGRQIQTDFGGKIDLLGIAPDGSLVVIELKKHRTPREVVAQAIDYASWVENLDGTSIEGIYKKYKPNENLEKAFEARFSTPLLEENLNKSHQIVIVAAELDPSTERIISYLSDRNIAVNVVFFEVFSNGSDQFLVRRWFVDPATTQINKDANTKNGEPWNGQFYVSFGEGESRSWEDARKYGFISAGGGPWYSRTLNVLKPGDRVWVRIPKVGYVGVGIVECNAITGNQFKVLENGHEVLFLGIDTVAEYHRNVPEEDQEFFVRIKWLKTLSIADAYNELGFFGNQNSVCKPTTPTWRSTIESLKARFKISD